MNLHFPDLDSPIISTASISSQPARFRVTITSS